MEQNHMLQRPSVSRCRPGDSSPEPWPARGHADSQAQSDELRGVHGHQSQPYQFHDPASLQFPDAPTADLPPIQPPSSVGQENANMLPSLSSVTGSQPFHAPPQLPDASQPAGGPATWAGQGPRDCLQPRAAESPARMDIETSSNSVASGASPDYFDGRASSVSLDDPDVRLAAEALGDLRADFLSSPPNSYTSLPGRSPSHSSMSPAQPAGQRGPQKNEPLLSLLTTSHPLLATTIGGAASAYNSSKNYSPRFKSGAEYVEGYLGPVAKTVGSVGRATGVEGSVRWFLGRKQSQRQDLESAEGASSKRRKVEGWRSPAETDTTLLPETPDGRMPQSPDASGSKSSRRLSQASTIDTLPTYEESLRPYAETEDGNLAKGKSSNTSNAPWQSRLIMSTSGLSIAMSDESLRSLKYCLTWLRWANDHIGKVIATLKTTLEQYEQAEKSEESTESGSSPDGNEMKDVEAASPSENASPPRADRKELAARINMLKKDVIKTLRDVVETVSKYTGGALPDNAKVLVRRHLTSLPRKWQLAMVTSNSSRPQSSSSEQQQLTSGDEDEKGREKNVKEGAQRVLILAKEGLEMMGQVSDVLDGTIVSAEEWCERLGKKRKEDREANTPRAQPPLPLGDGDVKMG